MWQPLARVSREALGGGARDSSCTSAQKRVCPSIVRMEGGQRNDVIFFFLIRCWAWWIYRVLAASRFILWPFNG